jgi:hypothetical protein
MTAEERLDDLLLRWQEEHHLGRDVPAAELCRDSAELAGELARRIDAVRHLERLADVTPVGDTGAAGAAPAADDAWLAGLLDPAQQPDEAGRLGSYRVLGVLGRGGMGVVLRAEDPVARGLVARSR